MGLGVGWEDSSRIIVEALWLEQRGTLVRNGPVKEGPGLSPGEQAEGLGRPASVGSGASKPRGREWKPETFLVTVWLVGRWLIWQVRESPGVQRCSRSLDRADRGLLCGSVMTRSGRGIFRMSLSFLNPFATFIYQVPLHRELVLPLV